MIAMTVMTMKNPFKNIMEDKMKNKTKSFSNKLLNTTAPSPAVVAAVRGMQNPTCTKTYMGTGKSNLMPNKRQIAEIQFRIIFDFFPDLRNMIIDLIQICPIEQIPRIVVSYRDLPTKIQGIIEERLRGKT